VEGSVLADGTPALFRGGPCFLISKPLESNRIQADLRLWMMGPPHKMQWRRKQPISGNILSWIDLHRQHLETLSLVPCRFFFRW